MKRTLFIIAAPITICSAFWLSGFDFSTRGFGATVTFVYSVIGTWFIWWITKDGEIK